MPALFDKNQEGGREKTFLYKGKLFIRIPFPLKTVMKVFKDGWLKDSKQADGTLIGNSISGPLADIYMTGLNKHIFTVNIMILRTTWKSGKEVEMMFIFYGVVDRKHLTVSEKTIYNWDWKRSNSNIIGHINNTHTKIYSLEIKPLWELLTWNS